MRVKNQISTWLNPSHWLHSKSRSFTTFVQVWAAFLTLFVMLLPFLCVHDPTWLLPCAFLSLNALAASVAPSILFLFLCLFALVPLLAPYSVFWFPFVHVVESSLTRIFLFQPLLQLHPASSFLLFQVGQIHLLTTPQAMVTSWDQQVSKVQFVSLQRVAAHQLFVK